MELLGGESCNRTFKVLFVSLDECLIHMQFKWSIQVGCKQNRSTAQQ